MIIRINPTIQRALESKHSVLVLGPRGSGKTYFLNRLIQRFSRFRTINLLDSQDYRKYLLNPELIYDELKLELGKKSSQPYFLMIDEVQLVPRILSEVHRCIDEFKPKVTFILTGSSARKLKASDVDLLAARAISVKFFPLNSKEIDFNLNFSKILRFGTLPEIYTTEDEWLVKQKLNTYVDTYLKEEIKKETEVRNIAGFHRFLEFAAAMNGQPLNYSKVGKAIGVTGPTVKEYFTILGDTLIATEVPAWTYSLKERLQLAPKYYFFDNGVMNALTGELSSEARESTYLFGRLFENMVVNEIIRQINIASEKIGYYHYRSEKGKEIDLILQRNPHTHPIAIEIKSAQTPEVSDLPELVRFKELYPNAICLVICRTEVAYEHNEIKFVNLSTALDEIVRLC